MSPRTRRASPEEARQTAAHALQHLVCDDCGAEPGQPCYRPDPGRSVHKSRYVAAAIEMKRALKAAALTLEQHAEAEKILAGLPKIPKSEFDAITTERGGLRATREWFVPARHPVPATDRMA